MKLIVQIPCLNEAETLPATLADIPRQIDGIDAVEVLIIDDGSTDHTAAIAREHGADHVVRFPQNRGLGYAFKTGFATSITFMSTCSPIFFCFWFSVTKRSFLLP